MNFCMVSVSKVEFWNFCNSFIFVKSCWWSSRKSICWRHNSSRRIRRSSSAWAAWSSQWPIFSQYSAIIICLCSSSKVLLCALELFSPTGFPVLSITFSAWVFSENLLWALYVFLVTPKPIDWSTSLSPTGFPDLSTQQTKTTDWLTRLLVRSNRLVLGVLQWASCRVSSHPRPGLRQGSWGEGLMSSGARWSHGRWAHNLWGVRAPTTSSTSPHSGGRLSSCDPHEDPTVKHSTKTTTSDRPRCQDDWNAALRNLRSHRSPMICSLHIAAATRWHVPAYGPSHACLFILRTVSSVSLASVPFHVAFGTTTPFHGLDGSTNFRVSSIVGTCQVSQSTRQTK